MGFDPITILIFGLPILLAVPLHEAAHGMVAHWFGDPTAKNEGRLTLNPIKHVDPFGTLVLPGLLVLSSAPFVFGWAKPVPVNVSRLRNPRWHGLLVAAAGPAMNILLAAVSILILRAMLPVDGNPWWAQMLIFSVLINVVLAVFNMLPLLPLDGGRVLNGLLPPNWAEKHAKTERFGMAFLLLIIIVPPMLGQIFGKDWSVIAPILMPSVNAVSDFLFALLG